MTELILLAHGSGGRLGRDLIDREILSRFGKGPLAGLPDAAELGVDGDKIIFSTDGFVVSPLFFPGGCIGDLAVHGTVNDIAVCGGRPLWLSVALIIEEGLPLADFRRILDAVKSAADACEVVVATGDTKVVGRGQCDGMYITTAGIGAKLKDFQLSAKRMLPGDLVIASGTLGDHAMAVLAARESLSFQNGPISDTAPVHRLVLSAADLAAGVRIMRDPTRGGAAAVLNELVSGLCVGVVLDEAALPFAPGSKAAAEMMGFDLLQAACEGRLLAVVAREAADEILQRWRTLPEGAGAVVIGRVQEGSGRVLLRTFAGGERFVDVPEGELLPRIC